MTTEYICVFKFRGVMHQTSLPDGVAELSHINGFWVCENMCFTKTSNAKFWIPAAAIQHIEKIQVNDDD